MEFCLGLGHGIPWSSMENFPWNGTPWNSVWVWDMEFHGKFSMELHGRFSMELHGILSGFGTWNSMEVFFSFMEFQGIPWNSMEVFLPMEFHRVFFHGIFSWNSVWYIVY